MVCAITLYLLGMVVVVAENDKLAGFPLLVFCLAWPFAALAALVSGLIVWAVHK